MPLVRFLPPDDPRIRATVLAIADELTVDGLVLRYRVEETDDGLSGEEGTFTICSFWLVSALVEIGELERARELCERLLSLASPLGLYAEEIDPRSGRHLGNFPQAFTHLALINAVMHVIKAESNAQKGGWPHEVHPEAPTWSGMPRPRVRGIRRHRSGRAETSGGPALTPGPSGSGLERLALGQSSSLAPEHGRVQGEPVGRVGGVTAGQRRDALEPVRHRPDGQVQPAGRLGRIAARLVVGGEGLQQRGGAAASLGQAAAAWR